jgi:hypothetical protein
VTFAFNVVVSVLVISIAAWLSKRWPTLAGFIVAMPLASLLVLPLSYREHGDAQASIVLAKSIFVAIPVSLTFFLPFLLADRFGLSFWQAYGLGTLALPVGFVVHRLVTGALFG